MVHKEQFPKELKGFFVNLFIKISSSNKLTQEDLEEKLNDFNI